MLTKRDPKTRALLFVEEPSDKKVKKQDKIIISLEKDVDSLKKRLSTLQTKFRKLDKIVQEIKEK